MDHEDEDVPYWLASLITFLAVFIVILVLGFAGWVMIHMAIGQ